jgi:16S rRNA C967 or C1407 C5-methylase (RsmB/RsmF family)/NOL1/NOP2/fmu family ribosome biogenesis protein
MIKLPEDFINQIKVLFPTEFVNFIQAIQNPVKRSIRLNPSKCNFELNLPHTTWHKYGYLLPDGNSVTWDPLFHAGTYYVQESSSMFLKSILETIHKSFENRSIQLLDLCAAPGGKSTLLAETFLSNEKNVLVANEVIKSRVNILNENLLKWGYNNCIVTNNDPSDFTSLNEIFDVVLVDAPCSGEGMFRKDPEAINEWSLDHVQLCSSRQERIIHDIWPTIKPGGFLIYSTCTFNQSENSKIVQLLVDELDAIPCNLMYNIPTEIHKSTYKDVQMFQFLPHKVDGEGLFIAVLRKKEDASEDEEYSNKQSTTKKKNSNPKGSSEIKNQTITEFKNRALESNHEIISYGETWYAQHHSVVQLINKLKKLKIIRAGLPLGEVKGKDFIPDHALAMQSNNIWNLYPTRELTYNEAIQFLSKENITSKDNQGWTMVTYNHLGLGFIKELGNRTNNYYPTEWRIRNVKSDSIADFQLLNYKI